MKLNKLNIFLILLFILTISCAGFSVFEGYSVNPKSRKINKSTKNPDGTSGYMRFNEKWESEKNDEEKKKEKKAKEQKEKNTYRDIVKFEDIVKQNALKTSIRPIPKSQIPKGKEHLYIKKSNVILPSCPVCPTLKKCDTKLCPPCPEPEVCPNNPVDCKMVPMWNDPTVKKYLPKPIK
tara:strand:+ start:3183 stop:3719 length:537 start_codon:yes stop_codon:yes gene_type:complete